MSEDGTKREEIKEENHELEDDEQDELEDEDDDDVEEEAEQDVVVWKTNDGFYGSYYAHTRLFYRIGEFKKLVDKTL